jgi:hypothetical protein
LGTMKHDLPWATDRDSAGQEIRNCLLLRDLIVH